ncbi:MAG: glycosyltransferase family 4 protein [Actinobacteria bacterium]|nr:MAG: glycosyltransferase family 4 protein [Actinomycetota bacterium]TML49494.1 MAG: glycosyltransferase family 4 protein [Actinomycetota bacterium]TML74464.1 MAG: glycosyltransferase family 4 protein [Actinomycetota bacterium]
MSTDARGRKVAVVADSRLEALLPELAAKGYGTIQLPPAGLEDVVAAAWLEQVAEHVAEFLRSDYEVVIAGDGSDEEKLQAKLAELGVAEPLAQYAIQPPSTSRLTPDT